MSYTCRQLNSSIPTHTVIDVWWQFPHSGTLKFNVDGFVLNHGRAASQVVKLENLSKFVEEG